MASSQRELDERKDKFPTHRDIEQRAYEIYFKRGQEEGHAVEHWLTAEVQLLREHAETLASEAVFSSNDLLVAEEERVQVRAVEELKQSGRTAVLKGPRQSEWAKNEQNSSNFRRSYGREHWE